MSTMLMKDHETKLISVGGEYDFYFIKWIIRKLNRNNFHSSSVEITGGKYRIKFERKITSKIQFSFSGKCGY